MRLCRKICCIYLPVAVIFAAAFFSQPARAAEQWVKLETPHFELYTTAGEKKGREAILYFEQVRSFFLQAFQSKPAPQFPARIVAFRSEKEYKPYRISETAFAYYARSRNRDYIVMQNITNEHFPVAIHEYTHLIIENLGLHLPIWLNEGWAELYSTLKPRGKKAMVGDLIPGRVATLLTTKWINLDVLTSVGQDSPFYNEKDRASVFYAQSWLLTHMLYMTPDYRPNFNKFVQAVNDGMPADEACQKAFGKHLWEVQVDLQNYPKSPKFLAELFDIKLEKSAEDPEVSSPSDFESSVLLANLFTVAKKNADASKAYEQLAKSNPDKPEIEESLGYLSWQTDDTAGARRHFAKALAAGTKDPKMCFQYAMLERQAGGDVTQVGIALKKAVELKPDYLDARMQLGTLLLTEKNYSEAIEQLRAIKSIPSEQAHPLFSALAYAYLQAGDMQQARTNSESAKKYAKTPEQTRQAESMLKYLDDREAAQARAAAPPPSRRAEAREPYEVREEYSTVNPANPFITKADKMSRVEGTAQNLDCSGDSALLHVLVGKQPMIFEIPDPERVVIKHSGELRHEFACGLQKPFHMIIDYAILPDAKLHTAGIVRGLEF